MYDMFDWAHEITHGVMVTPPTREDEPPQRVEVEMDTFCFINRDQAAMSGLLQETKLAFGSKEQLAKFVAWASQFLDVEGRKLVREAMQAVSGITVPEVELPPGVERRTA